MLYYHYNGEQPECIDIYKHHSDEKAFKSKERVVILITKYGEE